MQTAGDITKNNLLSDEEWLDVNDCVLALHAAPTHENVRYQTLLFLMNHVSFHTAAFFITSAARGKHDGCFIIQPLGTEKHIDEFETLVRRARAEGQTCYQREHSCMLRLRVEEAESPVGDVVMMSYEDEEGFLGILVLGRTSEEEPFGEHDLLILRALEPHVTLRLSQIIGTGGTSMLHSTLIIEELGLTKRELEVLSCVAFGMTPAEIALKLCIKPATAKKHLEHIYRKTGVNNRMSLMRLAQQYMIS